jgi:hypothetical protein
VKDGKLKKRNYKRTFSNTSFEKAHKKYLFSGHIPWLLDAVNLQIG